ncbi:MAG: N-6 DNA methylase [Armatimonadota bacterium]
MNVFPAVRIEGGLLASDIPERLLTDDLPGQKPADFGITGRRSLTDEVASLFAQARLQWEVFQHRLARLPDDDPATSVTREGWVVPFLRLLGYELYYNWRAYEVDGLTFAVSHRAGRAEDTPPVHIVGYRQDLGRLAPTGRPRLAPHSLVQEFLNRTEHLWGVVTNGRVLRLLRDSTYVRRQAYIEFDLEQIFQEQRFADFELLFRLLHRSRLPHTPRDAHECLLEQYYQYSLEQGGRVRDRLRDGVEECIKQLANGFLVHPDNQELRERVLGKSTCEAPLSSAELYSQLLRLVYRFLFLLVSEDRGLISADSIYREHYGVARLRRLVDQRSAYTPHEDIWCSLRVLWRTLCDERLARLLGAAPLDGELFAEIDLDRYTIANSDLLKAFRHLAYYRESPSSPLRRVNYAALDVEELGSVYESLLEYHPVVTGDPPRFDLQAGTERKSTGSYYTPPELVAELVKSALEPVIERRLAQAKTAPERERALLSIRVLDPACGSGHFLLAAARRLGKEVARVRTGEEEPAPEVVREATRDVVTHCIYGVDKNPLAVELCKLALWLEAHCAGKPLTFLDHHIRCGDSLVGVTLLETLKAGIPDEAYKRPEYASSLRSLRQRNALEQAGQQTLSELTETQLLDSAVVLEQIMLTPDDTPQQVHQKQQRYAELCQQTETLRRACNLWTAAFFWNAEDAPPPTTGDLHRLLQNPAYVPPQTLAHADALARQHRFFHWCVEFPDVYLQGGFDVVLGNPPWERIKLQEQEFFAGRNREIADAPNAAARKQLIQNLREKDPALWREYQQALRAAEHTSHYLRTCGQYPLTGRGDINTYSVFAERMRRLLKEGGRAGIIVPTGIATDDTNKHFFADLVDRGELVSLYDFENRDALFPHVHRSYKFCLLTVRRGGDATAGRGAEMAFFCTRAEHLRDPRRVFTLSPRDIARLNPNTRTLPVFRTRQDAELTRAIYARVPVLVNERTGENPWGVRFLRMFDMSNDSHLFRTREQMEREGFHLAGNTFVKGEQVYLPLYEAKMIWHYDHRYGTYEGVDSRSSTELPTPDATQHADPAFVVQPWYWVPAEDVEARLGDWKRGWLLGFRDVTNATNERTAIFAVLPRVGVGNNLPLVLIHRAQGIPVTGLLANVCSIVFDYVTRQKIAGVNMNFFFVAQLPVLPPSAYTQDDLRFIVPRVLELVYTAWDLKPFADDVWRELGMGSGEWGKQVRKEIIRQWEACHGVGLGEFLSRFGRLERGDEPGGDVLSPDRTASSGPVRPGRPHPESFDSLLAEIIATPHSPLPIPPFRWNEERRARLRAELDARYARLYGLTRKQLRYILDPADLTEAELENLMDPSEDVGDPLDPEAYARRCEASTFPGETFRVLKEKELRQYGEYRTRRLILQAWQQME